MKKVILAGVLAALTTAVTAQAAVNIKEIKNPKQFNALLGKKTIVAKFYSPDCPHCVSAQPHFEWAADKYGKRAQFVEVSYANNKLHGLFDKYGVRSFPTFVLIDKKGNVDSSFVGANSKDDLQRPLDKFLGKQAS